ncbi:esterase [Microbacterium sp. H6]|nr:esterase [Microbacterium sp. H6]
MVLGAALGVTAAVAAGAGGAIVPSGSASASRSRADLVLIHGGSHGGWAWRRVVDELDPRRGRILTPTLPGVGDRAHRLSPDIRFQDGVDDIVATIDAEELRDVVLVGHSIGGAYVSAVAERISDRLRGAVYLDAVVVDPGERILDVLTPASRAALPTVVAQAGQGYYVPKPQDPTMFGVTRRNDVEWLDRRLTGHPWSSWSDVVPITGPIPDVPLLYIDCTAPPFADVGPSKDRVRARPERWSVTKLAAGHDALVTAPADVARLIRRFSAGV